MYFALGGTIDVIM